MCVRVSESERERLLTEHTFILMCFATDLFQSDIDLQSVLQLIQTFDKGRLEIVRSAVQRRLDNM